MKRILSLFLIFLLFSAVALPIFANEMAASKTLLESIQSVPLEEIDSRLCDPAKFSEEIDFDAVRSNPVLPICLRYDWSDYGLSFDELSALAKEDDMSVGYVSFTESPVVFSPRTDGLFHTVDDQNGLPRYLQDIPTFSTEMTLLGEVCTISEILCFDDEWWHNDLIFFRTDKGDFVRVYSYSATDVPYVDYRLETFQVYAKAYSEYLTSLGNTGGFDDFLSFTRDYDAARPQKILYTCLGAVVLLGAVTAVVVLVVRARKRKASGI